MQEALNSIGVNYKLLIAQLVNFVLLLIVLYFFLYKPVLKMLNARSKKVSKSLEDAEAIEKRLVEVELEVKEKLSKADKQADGLMAEVKEQGATIAASLKNDASKEVQKILDKAKVEIETQKNKMLIEVQAEVANLVSDTIKIIAGDNKVSIDKKIIDDTLTRIKKESPNG